MRIRKVTAHAFGPLAGETLEFADGMTVVVGDNESGKSSWHAAIYAALCGRRRGYGRPRKDEQPFIDLRKPWDSDDWLVSAEIVLDDGRHIELRQDLAGKIDCGAKDLAVGRDVSAEVMNEGAPDGARWLGLDRSSFMATACVEQAQMLRVLHEAGGLQQHLQRAAATARADATAAAALERIAVFDRDHVGTDRANATKPLRRALNNTQRAQQRLAAAQQEHDQYLRHAADADALRDTARRAEASVRAQEAAHAAYLAGLAEQRAQRAVTLHEILGDSSPPTIADGDLLAQQAAAALTAWRSRPTEPVLAGADADELQRQLDALPPMPEGDLEAHGSVQHAQEHLRRAEAQLQQHDADQPTAPNPADNIPADDGELLDLAHTLETPLPAADPDLAAQAEAARRNLEAAKARSRTATLILAGAGAAVLAGFALLATVSPLAGVVLVAAGVALAALGLARRRSGSPHAALRRHADLQAQLNAAQQQAAAARRRHEEAVTRCRELGLRSDPQTLRRVVSARSRSAAYTEDLQAWQKRHSDLEHQVTDAADMLSGAVAARGHPAASARPSDLTAAVQGYDASCRQRAEQATQARQRDHLRDRLDQRRREEQRAAQDREQRAKASRMVNEAAAACSLPPDTPDRLATALEAWAGERGRQVEQVAQAQKQWAELQALLDGHSLEEVQQEADRAARRAEDLAALADPAQLAAAAGAADAERLPQLREEARNAATLADRADGELRQYAESVTSVAEAEEALEASSAELDRVRGLQATLSLTRRFLENAQDRVHRNIAPALAATLKESLPAVTTGRYNDAMVNPTTLQVEVCGPSRLWRKADLLSYGTAEQVYLLLRIALADHLTRSHDTCPLILDDVTVHADATRTRDILDLLLKAAADRQVIIFTQEEQVAAWARERLTGPDHTIRTLEVMPAI